MSYRAGIGEGMGVSPRVPHIKCDEPGCRNLREIGDLPPEWFLEGKAPPGWRKRVGERPATGWDDRCRMHK